MWRNQPKAVEKLEKRRSGLKWWSRVWLKIRSTHSVVLSPHITAGCWCDNAHDEGGIATSTIVGRLITAEDIVM